MRFKYFGEWFSSVPGKVYAMLAVLIPLVGGGVALTVWLITKGLDWWWAVIYLFVVLAFAALSYQAYAKVATMRDNLKEELAHPKETETTREARAKIRQEVSSKIPGILESMRQRINEIASTTKIDNLPKEEQKLLATELLSSLGVGMSSDKLEALAATRNVDEVSKLFNQLQKSTGIVVTQDLDQLLKPLSIALLKIDGCCAMHGVNIRQMSSVDQSYQKLQTELSSERGRIYSVEVNNAIENYILWIFNLSAFSLLMQGDNSKDVDFIPKDKRFVLPLVKPMLDTFMSMQLEAVKKKLEDYFVGK